MNILIVEGSHNNAKYMQSLLEPHYAVAFTFTGDLSSDSIASNSYDLIIIGSYIPDIDYVMLTKNLRREGVFVPILIVASKGSKAKAISALRAGADDFLMKPIEADEFKAKAVALLRRSNKTITDDLLKVGDLEFNMKTLKVNRKGQIIQLRRKEMQMLEFMMRHPHQVIFRNVLFENVWGYQKEIHANTVDVHIKYLRDKIDKNFEGKMLKTVHGYGYMLTDN